MTTLEDLYKTDPDKEAGSGIVLDFGGGKEVCIRRAGGRNRRFSRVLAEKQRPYLTQIRAGTLDPEVEERLMMETYAETVVQWWKGIKTEDGNDEPDEPSRYLTKFQEMPDFFNEIRISANTFGYFKMDAAEQAAKNLSGDCEPISSPSLAVAT